MTEHDSIEVRADGWQRDPEMVKFSARMAMVMSGEIPSLGDEMIASSDDDEPDGGELAILHPRGIPPHLSSIALKQPGREPLVDLIAA